MRSPLLFIAPLLLCATVPACTVSTSNSSPPPARTSAPPTTAPPAAPPTAPFCAVLGRRAARCPTEHVPVSGCTTDEKCLSRVWRQDANAQMLDCIERYPCNPPQSIMDVCLGTLSRVPLSPLGTDVQRLCALRACGGRVAGHCPPAPRLYDSILSEFRACFGRISCDDVGNCTESTLDRWGCH
jgi:hypothetical protein